MLCLSIRRTKYTWKRGSGVASEDRCCAHLELFVAFKPPDRPQWDKHSRIVKDYAGLLLRCIRYYGVSLALCVFGCWWGHMFLPEAPNRGSVLSRKRCVINTSGATLYIFPVPSFLSLSPPWSQGLMCELVSGMGSFSSLCVQSLQPIHESGSSKKCSMNEAMLIRLFLDRALGNVSIIETWVSVCTCVGVQAGEVLREERAGVNINNEELKCHRKRVKGERGDRVDEYTGGVYVCVERAGVGTACSCTWGDNKSVQHIFWHVSQHWHFTGLEY